MSRYYAPSLTLYDHAALGLMRIRFRFSWEVIEALKQIPGCRYAPELGKGNWLGPDDMVDTIGEIAANNNLELNDRRTSLAVPTIKVPRGFSKRFKKAHPYQMKGAVQAAAQGAFLLNWEMGLGKCLGAILALELRQAKRVLIVCPAMARNVWDEQLEKWSSYLPDCVVPITTNKAAKVWVDNPATGTTIVVPSYDLCRHFKDLSFDAIIIDESHMCKEGRAARSKAVAKLRKNNPEALFLELTGTAITNEPKDLWHQLDLLRPGCYGTFFQFCRRYCNSAVNEYADSGLEFFGLNEEYAPELERRLALVSSRKTKTDPDVAPFLPKLQTQTIYVDPPKTYKARELLDCWSGERKLHEKKLDAFLQRQAPDKIKIAVDWVENARENGVTHICILTHLIDTAKEIEGELRERGHATTLVTGKAQPQAEKRHKALKKAIAAPDHFVVATMHSVGIAIDLTPFTQCLFAELYWSPGKVNQALSRFYRLNSDRMVNIAFLVARGTIDEAIMISLKRKLDNMGELIAEGVSEKKLSGALTDKETDQEFAARMRRVAENFNEEDPYL